MYLRDAWYAAAVERELADRPLAVRMLEEDIVLYRRSDGVPAALEDACVHRKLPLSMGRIKGDHLECGYHGLTFDSGGRCVRIPCSAHIPKNAQVRSYPIVARYGLLWIWMGEAARADPAAIFEVPHWRDAGWGVTPADVMTLDCHYLLITDNLLDPSHVAWVHPGSFGNAACEATPVQVAASPRGLIASRWMRDVEVAPLYRDFVRFEGHCDRLQHYEVRYPSHALIRAVFVPAGAAGPAAGSHPAAFVMDSYNFLTPVDASHTRYFWFQMRNVFPDDAAVTLRMAAGVRAAFEEDRAILNAIQQNQVRSKSAHIDIAIDSAPLRFRRGLHRLTLANDAPKFEAS